MSIIDFNVYSDDCLNIFFILKFVLRLTLIMLLLCLLSLLKISQMSKNSPKILMIKYINENINGNEVNISKEQIINDILNGKMTQNKKNLTTYSQSIQITKEEYERLSKYKEEYNQKIENGNVNIIN